ncbi:MAG: tRNA (adenosine(37)-N6)-dimethylallyltransferase MiaA [Acutalibacteraceae bacterium]
MSDKKIPLAAVVGPTASGKTALAVELAQRLDGEIVSADSMQIYREMNIATAKPTLEEQKNIPHHLLDFLPPESLYSVADYVVQARKVISDIHARGKLPILCGGTGLYYTSLVDNVQFFDEEHDEVLREQLNRRYSEEGGESLLAELQTFDPETAVRLHPSDNKRIIRAIEVYRLTGETMSARAAKSKQEPSPYNLAVVGLNYADRSVLYERINRRVDIMLAEGLIDEAKAFYAGKFGKTAAAAIGYKELKPYLDGIISLEEATEKLKQETRRYAKRQLTWFRKDQRIFWIEMDKCSNPTDTAEIYLHSKLF